MAAFVAGGIIAAGTTYGLVLAGRTEPPASPTPHPAVSPAAIPSFEPRHVGNVPPPAELVEAAREQVVDELTRIAHLQQRALDRTGAFATFDRIAFAKDVPEVTVLTAMVQPTGFCVEAAHAEVPGTRLRYISVTGEIDAGACDPERPLEEQIGDDRAAQSGGHMEISNVTLRRAAAETPVGAQFDLVFDARWTGPGLPVEQLCGVRMWDRDEGLTFDHSWGFSVRDLVLDDYVGQTVFESQLDAGLPVRAELDCRNRW